MLKAFVSSFTSNLSPLFCFTILCYLNKSKTLFWLYCWRKAPEKRQKANPSAFKFLIKWFIAPIFPLYIFLMMTEVIIIQTWLIKGVPLPVTTYCANNFYTVSNRCMQQRLNTKMYYNTLEAQYQNEIKGINS